ncbi:DUF262 domain-containing protein [Pelagicoccus sp. SDUM812002]|uniref:GmrSD restriction endonuclease domain-containing protein n=1 Tax=Pelagicoccus sp. SDUM812002 TaxID=3041266 RepID=UPI00280CC13A|nr:DUF262 domain-containing protein [Pelagicoccus sp. SDUM812002]MDQ8184308.1 DUF262 domain-containing protein [Pelagicoccus sp. SDUM812002]
MSQAKYSVNQHPISIVLAWIQQGEIAIPEIQRPFVWSKTQVRDLMDSLLRGFPVGYLIAWKNPNIKLKDGTTSEGKRILIDGQQRVTALMTAVSGMKVLDKDYKSTRIRIAYHPIDQRFEVFNKAIEKDSAWLTDIALAFAPEFKTHKWVGKYCEANPEADEDKAFEGMDLLTSITSNQLGLIELDGSLDIETVTEIFIRINGKGAVLSQADFAMSKIASSEKYGGDKIRKTIDYFCHLAIAPEFYETLVDGDSEYCQSDRFRRMAWLRNENDNLYDPEYTDMLRVAFTTQFGRGKLQDLVALLSGRNFETRSYEESIAESSFAKLQDGLDAFMSETNFKRFVMIIRSTGFVDPSLIGSGNTLNFAYVLYLHMRSLGLDSNLIESAVRRWFVMSILTRRYSGNPESAFDLDIRRINERGPIEHLESIEQAELGDAYWQFGLVQSLETSVASSPFFKLFLAAQIKANDKAFLSKDITVTDIILNRGDLHHIFPRNFLKKHGIPRSRYNQIANFAITQTETNIKIRDREPSVYFADVVNQTNGGEMSYGAINNPADLAANLETNCIPENLHELKLENYDEFLKQRRMLMAVKLKNYYSTL